MSDNKLRSAASRVLAYLMDAYGDVPVVEDLRAALDAPDPRDAEIARLTAMLDAARALNSIKIADSARLAAALREHLAEYHEWFCVWGKDVSDCGVRCCRFGRSRAALAPRPI